MRNIACDVVIVVPTEADAHNVFTGLAPLNTGHWQAQTVQGATVGFCTGPGDVRYAITWNPSLGADDRRCIAKLAPLVKDTGCHCLLLVNCPYTDEDLKRRRADIPSSCATFFVHDLELLLNCLNNPPLDALRRAALAQLFPGQADVGAVSQQSAQQLEEDEIMAVAIAEYFGQSALPAHSDEDDDDAYDQDDEDADADAFMRMAAVDAAETGNPIVMTPALGALMNRARSVVHTGPGNTNVFFDSSVSEAFANAHLASRRPLPSAAATDVPHARFSRRVPNPVDVMTGAPTREPAVQTVGDRRRAAQAHMAARALQRDLARMVAKPEVKKKLEKRNRTEEPGIAAMPVSADDNTCMICLHSHVTTAALPCGDLMFCNACITKWLAKSKTCPHCRAEVLSTVQVVTKFNPNEEAKKQKQEPAKKEVDQ